MRFLEPVVRLAEKLVDRAELLVALSDLGRLRHVEAEREPGHAQRHREDEDAEHPKRLVREREGGALHRGRPEVHRHPAVVRAPDGEHALRFGHPDRDRGQRCVHEEVRSRGDRDRQQGWADRRWRGHAAAEPVELSRNEGRHGEGPEVERGLAERLAARRHRVHDRLRKAHPDRRTRAVQHIGGDDRRDGDRDRAGPEQEHRHALGDASEHDQHREHQRIDRAQVLDPRRGDERHEASARHRPYVQIKPPVSSHRDPSRAVSQDTLSHATLSHDTLSHVTLSQLIVSQLTASQLTVSQRMPPPSAPLLARSEMSTFDG